MSDTTAAPPAVPDEENNLPATAAPTSRPEGLEDLDESDLTMPFILINHKEAKFKDSLSGKEFDTLEVVLLGLIKQRVLWEAEVEDNSKPLCKSYDFSIGHPTIKDFPWKTAGFERPADDDAAVTLPCENCKLQEWGTHPKRDAPWCSAQHTFAMLLPTADGDWAPALFTLQRSALKPSRNYMTGFQRDNKALYVCKTKLSLEARKRGTNDFAVPRFVEGEATEEDQWPRFSSTYRRVRNFVQTPRGREDDESGSDVPGGDTNPSTAPAGATAPTGGPNVPDDDELPF